MPEEEKGRPTGAQIEPVAPILPGSARVSKQLPREVALGLSPRLHRALNHRVRRGLLRFLRERPDSVSSREIDDFCDAQQLPRQLVESHLGVLADCNAVRVENVTAVSGHRLAIVPDRLADAVLVVTQAWDSEPPDALALEAPVGTPARSS